MKKFVIGCAVALVLMVIGGSAAVYYFVYKPAKSFVSSMTEFGALAEADEKVANTATFTPPESDTLTEAQVRRFAAVQESLHAKMGARATELRTKYEALSARGKDAGLTEVVGAYKDIFSIVGDAKRAQVDALNSQQFSLAEYGWVKARVYEAAGVSVSGIDFRELAGKLQSGDLQALQQMVSKAGDAVADAPKVETDMPEVGVPEANKTLVAPYKDKISTWMIYGAFGLRKDRGEHPF